MPKVRIKPPCLLAALDYVQRGWSAIALCPHTHEGVGDYHRSSCTRPGKVPLGKWGEFQDHLAKPQTLELLWRRHPNANVGVCLGPVSKLIGVDIDGPAGEQLLVQWAGGAANIPATLAFHTPGGHRLLFALPEGVELPIRSFKADQKEAVRILAHGSQTVMPPSVLANGEYRWIEGCGPGEIEAAPCPPWLLAVLLGESAAERDDREDDQEGEVPAPVPPPVPQPATMPDEPRRLKRARAYVAKCEPAVSGQGGHNQTYKIACKLVGQFKLSDDEALDLLLNDYNPRCQPPWSEKELLHKVQSARQHHKEDGRMADEPPPKPEPTAPACPIPNAAPRGASPLPVPPKRSAPPVQVFTASDLMARQFGAMRWAVDGLIPEGASILAGRPKTGKSWLVLGLALAVADGTPALNRVAVQQGDVLYLALEDGPRRLQRRLRAVLGEQEPAAPPLLHLSCAWPRSSEGGIPALERWLDAHSGARLIVIDTLARVRDRRRGDVGIYDEDYEAIAGLQALGMRRSVAVLIITHTRKPKSGGGDDPLDEVQNTTGLTGAADAVLVLKRARYAREGKLFVTGRDVDEREVTLDWNASSCRWTQGAEPAEGEPEARLSPDQRRIRELLREAGRPLGLIDLNARLRKDYSATAQLVHRMTRDGLLKKVGYGSYTLPDDAVSNLSNCQTQPEA